MTGDGEGLRDLAGIVRDEARQVLNLAGHGIR
jgi:hypothetical protein